MPMPRLVGQEVYGSLWGVLQQIPAVLRSSDCSMVKHQNDVCADDIGSSTFCVLLTRTNEHVSHLLPPQNLWMWGPRGTQNMNLAKNECN